MSLLVLCPSKGRPEKAQELLDSFNATKRLDDTKLVFVIDEGEVDYPGLLAIIPPSGRRGMVDPLNTAYRVIAENETWDTIGFVGDDHRFRTPGWDAIFSEILAAGGGGLIYGNDLNWPNGEIPTMIFGSAWVWDALGWMALPSCQHLYVDNAWRVIGEETNRLWYVPEVIIEHVHPAYSKAEWDEGYRAVNSSEMYSHDRAAFEAWLQRGADEDIGRVRSASR